MRISWLGETIRESKIRELIRDKFYNEMMPYSKTTESIANTPLASPVLHIVGSGWHSPILSSLQISESFTSSQGITDSIIASSSKSLDKLSSLPGTPRSLSPVLSNIPAPYWNSPTVDPNELTDYNYNLRYAKP
jgi:hypothetical protein